MRQPTVVEADAPSGEARIGAELSARDEQFLVIVEDHQTAVFAYFRARMIQANDAEDLTQEVFVRYYKGQPSFHSLDNQRPFLLGIARNLLRERARKLKRRNEISWTELCLEVEQNREEPDGRYDQYMVWLPRCLEKLADKARQAMRLHYHDKLQYDEIAKTLRRTTGAVKLLMFRARQSLKKCLDRAAKEHSND